MGWLWGRAGGGGGGHANCTPTLPLPHIIHIYLYGCGGLRGRQVIQDSACLAWIITKLARIILQLRNYLYKAEGFIYLFIFFFFLFFVF